jgi:hypothetical protein
MGALNIIYKTENIFFQIFSFCFAYSAVRQVRQANISAGFFPANFFFSQFFFRQFFFQTFFFFVTNFHLMFLFWPNQKAELQWIY